MVCRGEKVLTAECSSEPKQKKKQQREKFTNACLVISEFLLPREMSFPEPRSGRRVMAGESTTATPRYRKRFITRIISGSSRGAHHAIRPHGPSPTREPKPPRAL